MKLKGIFEKKPQKHDPKPEAKADLRVDPKSDNEARCKIKNVATCLFARFGLEGTSTREIAKETGLNLSLISYYFGGKEGLYKTLFVEFATEAHKEIEALLKTNLAAEETTSTANFSREQFFSQMKSIIQKMVRMQIENPDMMTLMQRETLEGLPHAREVWEEIFHSLGEKIVSVLSLAQDRKIIRSDLNLQFHFLSMIHSIDMIFIATRCRGPWEHKLFKIPDESDKIAQQIFTVFIEGIAV